METERRGTRRRLDGTVAVIGSWQVEHMPNERLQLPPLSGRFEKRSIYSSRSEGWPGFYMTTLSRDVSAVAVALPTAAGEAF